MKFFFDQEIFGCQVMALTGDGHTLNQTVIPMVVPLIDENCEFGEKIIKFSIT